MLCGGSGSRLWPLSRDNFPKQFLKFGKKVSSFQRSLKRAQLISDQPPIIICHVSHENLAKSQAEEMGCTSYQLLLEPVPKNTTMSILCGLCFVEKNDHNSKIVVLPADHMIHDDDAFVKNIDTACHAAEKVEGVLFGVKPTYPSTAYGYIAVLDRVSPPGTKSIESFKEKPVYDKAVEYIKSDYYYWNSGIFVFDQASLVRTAEVHVPHIMASARKAINCGTPVGSKSFALPADVFETVENISVDYGLIEKLTQLLMVVADFDWHDIGSFKALWGYEPRDKNQNVKIGSVDVVDTQSCYVHSEGPTVATLGVKNLSVIATKDAVLVAHMDHSEKIKEIAAQHSQVVPKSDLTYRPWGHFQTLSQEDKMFHVKKIIVKPGQILSLQKHRHRAEHWIILEGEARVTKNKETLILGQNDHVYIPVGCVHRIENIGAKALTFIEVQTGTYFGEDDIIRLEDAYGRKSED